MFDRVFGNVSSCFCQDVGMLLYRGYWPFSATYRGLLYAKLVNTQERHLAYQIRFSRSQFVRLFMPIMPATNTSDHNRVPSIVLDPQHV